MIPVLASMSATAAVHAQDDTDEERCENCVAPHCLRSSGRSAECHVSRVPSGRGAAGPLSGASTRSPAVRTAIPVILVPLRTNAPHSGKKTDRLNKGHGLPCADAAVAICPSVRSHPANPPILHLPRRSTFPFPVSWQPRLTGLVTGSEVT